VSWDRIKQHWTSWPGRLRQGWLELTDDDFDLTLGRRDTLVGHLHDRFGVSDDAAQARDQERQLAASGPETLPHIWR
jgi:uncharacterized protein YjbJ (UPF0337 family)